MKTGTRTETKIRDVGVKEAEGWCLAVEEEAVVAEEEGVGRMRILIM